MSAKPTSDALNPIQAGPQSRVTESRIYRAPSNYRRWWESCSTSIFHDLFLATTIRYYSLCLVAGVLIFLCSLETTIARHAARNLPRTVSSFLVSGRVYKVIIQRLYTRNVRLSSLAFLLAKSVQKITTASRTGVMNHLDRKFQKAGQKQDQTTSGRAIVYLAAESSKTSGMVFRPRSLSPTWSGISWACMVEKTTAQKTNSHW